MRRAKGDLPETSSGRSALLVIPCSPEPQPLVGADAEARCIDLDDYF